MARSVLTKLFERIEVNDVKDIIVTEITDDGDGGWTRAIRFMGDSGLEEEGANPTMVLEIIVRAPADKEDIEVTTPELNF